MLLEFRLFFSYARSMPVPTPIRVPVVRCKGCAEAVPSPTDTLPAENVTVLCGLCRAHRRYRPSEVYLGSPSRRLRAQALAQVR